MNHFGGQIFLKIWDWVYELRVFPQITQIIQNELWDDIATQIIQRRDFTVEMIFPQITRILQDKFKGNIATQIIQMGWFFPQITQIIKMNCRKISLRRLYRRILVEKEMT